MSATFRCSCPKKRQKIEVLKFQETLSGAGGSSVPGFRGYLAVQRCIVIADDDPIILELLKTRLGMAQYHVIATHDAITALEMAQTKDPVAVILDVQMPGG